MHDGEWRRVTWQDWLSFRELGCPFVPLPGVIEGDHHFVVCFVEDGRLNNIIRTAT